MKIKQNLMDGILGYEAMEEDHLLVHKSYVQLTPEPLNTPLGTDKMLNEPDESMSLSEQRNGIAQLDNLYLFISVFN